MSIREQKLFFTRNGKYTIWEMLNLLNEDSLDILFNYIYVEKSWTEFAPGPYSEFPSYIYKVYEDILKTEEDKLSLYNIIDQQFKLIEEPLNDFNGYIYIINSSIFDMKSILLNLEKLKDNITDMEIDNLEMEYYIYDGIDEGNHIVDFCFSNKKFTNYKQNSIEQIINTEIRIYVDLNIAVMTNYSDYTHRDSEKNKFINTILENISSHKGEIDPLKLSDTALRNLVLVSDQVPSKFKFDIEGRADVGVAIKNSSTSNNPFNHDEVKKMYEKFSVSQLKVTLSEDDEKYLIIDGKEGKIHSKSKNLNYFDIDSFVLKLSTLFKFDYLNYTYEKEIKNLANIELTGTENTKYNIVSTCYKNIYDLIKSILNDKPDEFATMVRNSFFHILTLKDFYVVGEERDSIDDRTLKYLSRITRKNGDSITTILHILIKISEENDKLEDLMVSLDYYIKNRGMISDAVGF